MHALALAVLLVPAAFSQQTWYVDAHATAPGNGSASSPFVTIQSAITAPTTNSGDTLIVRPGVYSEHVGITKSLSIVSLDGPLTTVITSAGVNPTVRANQNVALLEGFTLMKTNGPSNGEVVFLDGLNLRRCVVLAQDWFRGIYVDWGTIDHCLIAGASAAFGFNSFASVDIRNSILSGNEQSVVLDGSQPDPFSWIQYCIVDEIDGPFLNTNLEDPPLFYDDAGRDFHLRANSPCIDAGDPLSPLDPDGTRSDIGPLPFDASYAPFVTYCTAKVNSLGCVPQIDAVGSASRSAPTPFELRCTQELNNRPGLLFYGFAPKNTAYQGGYLCVASPVRRTQILDSGGNTGPNDCSGIYSFDFNAHIRSGTDALLEPGVEVFAQFWSRDPGASFTTNRSNAIRFTVLP